jgi:hypothetical protein
LTFDKWLRATSQEKRFAPISNKSKLTPFDVLRWSEREQEREIKLQFPSLISLHNVTQQTALEQ